MLFKLCSALLFLSIFVLNSCKKDQVDSNVYSMISVVNASPTVSTYDVYLSGVQINTAALPAGGALAYSSRIAGNYDLKFTTAGRSESIFTKTIGLPQNIYQTFFLVGRTASLDGFLVTDEQVALSTTQAYVRFVNAVPDSAPYDLIIKGGASVVTNKAFKTASAFTPVLAGTYTFDVKETTGGTVRSSSESVTLGANIYYTVLVKGFVTPAAGGIELPLSTQVTVNK